MQYYNKDCRAGEPANFLAAPAPDFFFQAAPATYFFPVFFFDRLRLQGAKNTLLRLRQNILFPANY